MSPRDDIDSVLVIGSGPIIIGQAAEFDYSGTQACKALAEEGIRVVLINSNPATIMTDKNIADRVYIEPLTVTSLIRIIRREQPDGILPTMGGQTGLNLAVELTETEFFSRSDVRLLGTDLEAIQKGEDRDLFKKLLMDLDEPCIESSTVSSCTEAVDYAREIGFPVIVRPAYTLGGSGGGIAADEKELRAIVEPGLRKSRIDQVLIEKSISGWKELEYEVVRDGADNCITVCNMENIDPVGVHTGDSIVVAPSQTLTDREYHLLRSAAIKIIRGLKVEGGCNIQFALDPESRKYYVIEVNPRVSRSSALASKATGYPIARVAAKIALGLKLDEIENPITRKTKACFEPALDYVVTKIPRWPFDKFKAGQRDLGTQMKATGEVMAIGRNFTESFLKAVASLDMKLPDFRKNVDNSRLKNKILELKDNRIFTILQGLYNGITPETLHDWTGIDLFYLYKFRAITTVFGTLEGGKINRELMKKAKKLGISDSMLADYLGLPEAEIRKICRDMDIKPIFKMVDTCASEFRAATPYYYSTYEEYDEVEIKDGSKVLVIGSGPIRIGQGIEFDYCSVHAVKALQNLGVEAVIANNNPETVSTDFDTGDKLYFEPLTAEYVLNIVEKEGIEDVILQFGGQTAINLAQSLAEWGVNILGTDLEGINLTEDRREFNKILKSSGIKTPAGYLAVDIDEALEAAENLGYPLLVRPSYVLGGRGMEIVDNRGELQYYLEEAIKISPRYPVLIDSYIPGKEVEVDAIVDGKDVLIPGIMEHIERAGVHSGDSMAAYPALNVGEKIKKQLVAITELIAAKIGCRGLINIQFVVTEGEILVLEVNPRASRTVPILCKVTGVPMIDWAVRVMLGESLTDITGLNGLLPPSDLVSVKVPVFSSDKLKGIDIHLNPEMKSTGEVLGTARDPDTAVYKGLLGAGFSLSGSGRVLFALADRDKEEGVELARRFRKLGYSILVTRKTGLYFREAGITVEQVDDPLTAIRKNRVDLVINTPTRGKNPARKGFKIRRAAVEYGVNCLTSLDTVRSVLGAKEKKERDDLPERVFSLDDYPSVL